jgi:hypothetical protein
MVFRRVFVKRPDVNRTSVDLQFFLKLSSIKLVKSCLSVLTSFVRSDERRVIQRLVTGVLTHLKMTKTHLRTLFQLHRLYNIEWKYDE